MPTADADAKRRILNRLRRANGQLAAVIGAVEQGATCRDVVVQLSAVSSALDRAGFAIISSAMKECLSDAEARDADIDNTDKLTTDELEKLFLMLA